MKRRSTFACLYAVLLSVAALGALACTSNVVHPTPPAASAGAPGSAGAPSSGNGGAGSTGTAGGGTAGDTTGTAGATPGTAGAAGSATGAAGDPMDAGAVNGDAADASGNPLAGWTLSWSDEFNGATGTKPDPASWGYDIGGGGWGVSQLQVYTSDAANASMDGNGNLQIVAIKTGNNYTSARLKTQNKFQQAYGRFEIRAKVVTGNGMWPAFWMLGADYNGNNWPQCGEVDIMEVRGTRPYNNGGSLHGPGYSGMHPLTGTYVLPHADGGPSLSDDFHTYAVEWETGVVRFYVDDNLFETHTPADIPADAGANAKWVYDHPFFILLNVAVGGTFPGPPDGTVFPQTMLVDYVRVYSRTNGGG
jgi:beta-glucanase (GH16 family)